MTTMITFNELRQIKDMLPSGNMQKIADELGLDVEKKQDRSDLIRPMN